MSSERERLVGLLCAFSLAAAASCAGLPSPSFAPAQRDGPVWPLPPEPPRVRWTGQYAAERGGYVRPHGLDAAPDGRLCVADPGGRVIWLHRPDGKARALGRDLLRSPVSCALLPDGGVAVADSAAPSVVFLDGRGKIAWSSAPGEFERPAGLVVDERSGTIWVADARAHHIVALDLDGRRRAVVGGRGSEPGQFNFPTAVTVGPEGRLHVLDSLNFRVQVLDADGTARLVFGLAGDGPGTFYRPRGLGVDGEGRVYVADALFDNVQLFDREGRLLLALGRRGRGPGEFWMPAGVSVAPDGRILVADAYNQRVQVFRLIDDAGPEGS